MRFFSVTSVNIVIIHTLLQTRFCGLYFIADNMGLSQPFWRNWLRAS